MPQREWRWQSTGIRCRDSQAGKSHFCISEKNVALCQRVRGGGRRPSFEHCVAALSDTWSGCRCRPVPLYSICSIFDWWKTSFLPINPHNKAVFFPGRKRWICSWLKARSRTQCNWANFGCSYLFPFASQTKTILIKKALDIVFILLFY